MVQSSMKLESHPSSAQPAADEQIATDEQLLLDYRLTGRRELFEALVRRYERELYTFLRRFLGDCHQAEDVFQATFLSVHQRAHQFEEGRRFKPWLYAIASNKAIDCQRRNKRHRMPSLDMPLSDRKNSACDCLGDRVEDQSMDPALDAALRETGQQVRDAVNQLSPAAQQLIQLAFYQGIKYADIAQALDIPLGTVKSRVHTAMRKLFEVWERMYPKDERIPPAPL